MMIPHFIFLFMQVLVGHHDEEEPLVWNNKHL